MNKLIIEAGGTKTTAVMIGDDSSRVISRDSFMGINPLVHADFLDRIAHVVDCTAMSTTHFSLWYYGAGCLDPNINSAIKKHIASRLASVSTIFVADDVLAAARATCGHQEGQVVILGTGAIRGDYDGQGIVQKVSSGGYLIGDEGSGFHIGKILMRRWLRGELIAQDQAAMEAYCGSAALPLLRHIYASDEPRHAIASLAKGLTTISKTTRDDILEEAFTIMIEAFLVRHPLPQNPSLHFLGSIAYNFRAELTKILQKFDIIASSFWPSAIDGLIEYHGK